MCHKDKNPIDKQKTAKSTKRDSTQRGNAAPGVGPLNKNVK